MLCLIICFSYSASFGIDFQNPEEWGNTEISRVLQSSQILSSQSMEEYLKSVGMTSSFTGDIRVLTLSDNIKAVFKPAEERKLEESWAEVIAYRASLEAGFPYIPPTVLREIEEQKGSLQLLVENLEPIENDDMFIAALRKIDPNDLAKLRVFSFVMGQWDLRRYNFLIKQYAKKFYITAIDSSNLFQRQRGYYGELPFVLIGSRPFTEFYLTKIPPSVSEFPFEASQILPSPSLKTFQKEIPEEIFEWESGYFEWVATVEKPLYVKYCNFRERFWRQYYFSPDLVFERDGTCTSGADLIILAYTSLYPQEVLKFLDSLTYQALQQLFDHIPYEKRLSYYMKTYAMDVLERRDQIIKDVSEQQK